MKTRNLDTRLNLKQKVITSGVGTPGKREGFNGDIVFRWIKGRGLFLFYKYGNTWFSARLSSLYPKNTKDKESVKIPVGKVPSKKGELGMGTSGKTYASVGAGKKKQLVGLNSSKILDIGEIKLERTSAAESGGAANTTADMRIKNLGTGNAQLHLQVLHDDADAYIRFSQFDVDPSTKLRQWAIGMDGSQSARLSFNSRQSGTEPITPSGGHSADVPEMFLDNSGNLTAAGTITSNVGACSGTGALDAANGVDNRLSTFTDANSLNGETNATFDGNILKLTNTVVVSPQLMCQYDGSTFFSINVLTGGMSTLKSTGDITISALGNCINFHDGTNIFGEINMSTASTLKLSSATNYHVNIESSGTGDVVLDSGGDIVIDSADGNFIAKVAGTEFSSANSSYAGMILGFTVDGNDSADQTYNLTTSYVVFDSDLSVTFITPPSELVEIQATFYYQQGNSGKNVFASISNHVIYGSSTLHHTLQHERAITAGSERGGQGIVTVSWYLIAAGLAAIGSSNTIYFGAKCDSTTGTPNIKWGGDATGEYQNFVMRAIALPA